MVQNKRNICRTYKNSRAAIGGSAILYTSDSIINRVLGKSSTLFSPSHIHRNKQPEQRYYKHNQRKRKCHTPLFNKKQHKYTPKRNSHQHSRILFLKYYGDRLPVLIIEVQARHAHPEHPVCIFTYSVFIVI